MLERRLQLLWVVLVLWGWLNGLTNADDTNLYRRSYPYVHGCLCRLPPTTPQDDLTVRAYFEKAGLKFSPTGSLRNDTSRPAIVLIETIENHKLFEALLEREAAPAQVLVRVALVRLPAVVGGNVWTQQVISACDLQKLDLKAIDEISLAVASGVQATATNMTGVLSNTVLGTTLKVAATYREAHIGLQIEWQHRYRSGTNSDVAEHSVNTTVFQQDQVTSVLGGAVFDGPGGKCVLMVTATSLDTQGRPLALSRELLRHLIPVGPPTDKSP